MTGTKVVALVLMASAIVILAYVGYSFIQKSTTQGTTTQSITQSTTQSWTLTKPTKTKKPPKIATGKPSKTKPGTKTPPPPKTTRAKTTMSTTATTGGPEEIKYETGFFKYKWLKYRIRAGGQTFTYTFENLGEEVVNGKPCYHQKITIEAPQKSEIEIWYDKATLQCVKTAITLPGVGRKEMPCSSAQGQMQAVPVTEGERMRYVGEEVITVPAGTFTCSVFEGSGVKSWIARDQGLLVKWVSSNSEGELLGYG